MGESPVFRIYSRLFCHAVAATRDPLIVRTHSLCIACEVMPSRIPDPCASIAPTATSPRRLQTVHTSRLPGRIAMCGMHSAPLLLDGFDVLIVNSVSISLFSLHVVISLNVYTHFHSGIHPCTSHDCASDAIVPVPVWPTEYDHGGRNLHPWYDYRSATIDHCLLITLSHSTRYTPRYCWSPISP